MRNLNIKTLDFATVHVDPCNWGIPANKYQWVNDNYIGDRASMTAANGKPLMFEVRPGKPRTLVTLDPRSRGDASGLCTSPAQREAGPAQLDAPEFGIFSP